ncbi:carboxymuconolactone decarboxylase family protein [Streptomyces sp. NBC_01481]|uniref:carboxymuconolactone decarboxylase family protein n=1 Tax=Streptomyces sp. NBC_01481 TaxID=2975869 RepID=UPI002256F57A|nr:carboxymuconolactone decarboxylase family protein [Streptomyces sp. NBC_01481]MCX4584545.1 carboxymuconolactone decarboxylase family protein [Streptomyces sp. NBC_01481]
MFTEHTLESAPPASRRAMESTIKHLGHLPPAVARLASSPQLLDGFLKLSAMFEQATLDPLAREVVIMVVATRNECHVCVEMHTGKLRALGADEELIAALRERRPVGDERLEAVRQFTLEALRTAGGVGDEELKAFFAHGYTEQNALEVVMGIGTYTMSTLANRLTRA